MQIVVRRASSYWYLASRNFIIAIAKERHIAARNPHLYLIPSARPFCQVASVSPRRCGRKSEACGQRAPDMIHEAGVLSKSGGEKNCDFQHVKISFPKRPLTWQYRFMKFAVGARGIIFVQRGEVAAVRLFDNVRFEACETSSQRYPYSEAGTADILRAHRSPRQASSDGAAASKAAGGGGQQSIWPS